MDDSTRKLILLSRNVMATLMQFGSPKTVLPACYFIAVCSARDSGATKEQLKTALNVFIDAFWDTASDDAEEIKNEAIFNQKKKSDDQPS